MDAQSKKTTRCLDKQFALWVARHFPVTAAPDESENLAKILLRVAEAVSYSSYIKHSCIDIDKYPLLKDAVLNDLLRGITAEQISKTLGAKDAAGAEPLQPRPLMVSRDGKNIWLQKYQLFEQHVAEDLLALKAEGRLEIITGGPGTGKTWTAAQRIQQTLLENPACVIALAAPTGKAANNMMLALSDAFAKASAAFDKTGHAAVQAPRRALTLHALLGITGRSPKPRHDKQHPLSCDLLVIDEASMIDLPMMYRLLQALPPQASLLLLGDKDQLASVEAGSVLHEICSAPTFSSCIKTLTESRRYSDSPEIGALAMALNSGVVMDMSANTKVRWQCLPTQDAWNPPWLASVVDYYRNLHASFAAADSSDKTLRTALLQQKQFQILCALREGPQGVSGINDLVETALKHNPDSWYVGKPIIITVNDHERKLYNGDVGLVLSINGVLKACFQVDGQLKIVSAAQMPAYETAYAITVHKSQGSEYQRVLVVLPAELAAARNNPVLTRELVYTAVTRAKECVDLWSGEGVLENAASKTLQRMSGLALKW